MWLRSALITSRRRSDEKKLNDGNPGNSSFISCTTGLLTNREIKALREEINALKEGQKAIQKDLQEIKGLLAPRPAAPVFKEAVLSIDGKPFKGNNEAKLTLIEFSEFQ
jgi:hypothetical protein